MACVSTTTTTSARVPETTAVVGTESPVPTTSTPLSTAGTSPPPALSESEPETTSTIGVLPITTPAPHYCGEQNNMGQPLTIQSTQVTFNLPSGEEKPSGDINPSTTTSGLVFQSKTTEVVITMVDSAELTVIYLPTNLPGSSTNVKEFTVVIDSRDGSAPLQFTSKVPSGDETPSTAPLTTTDGLVLLSDNYPQVKLQPNFVVPSGSTITIRDIKTTDGLNPTGVSITLK